MAKKSKSITVAEIFRKALKRKQQQHPSYSLRALARDLKVSPAFVSKVLSGKKLPPKDRLEKLAYSLELDVLEKEQVVKSVLLDRFSAKLLSRVPKKTKSGKRRLTTEATTQQLLSSWMNLAVLEGLTLSTPHNAPEALARRLGISAAELKRTLLLLEKNGLIEEREGQWQKKEEHLYLASGRTKAEVRAFHEMMIGRAGAELGKTSHEDYQRRLINGSTLALNPEHLERLKAKIIRFLDELSKEAGEGSCEDVYQCNIQLFPLTKAL